MRIILTLLILASIAGCTGNPATPAASDLGQPASTTAPAIAEGTPTGYVHGLVADEEYLPLHGVTVRLVEAGLVATSNDQGTFDFPRAPVRTHTLVAEKLGYFTKTVGLEVIEDKTVTPKIFLERNPQPVAYVDTSVEYTGLFDCAVAVTTVTQDACATATGSSKSFFQWHLGPGVATLLVELNWSPGSAAADRMAVQMYTYGTDGNFAYLQTTKAGGFPLRLPYSHDDLVRIDGANNNRSQYATDGEEIYTRVSIAAGSNGAIGAAANQRFMFYATQFYVDPMPEGFTRLGG